MLSNFFDRTVKKISESDLSLVWLALLLELLAGAYLAFLFLFSLEMLLPTFVSTKINLVKFSGFLFLFTFVAVALGRFLRVQFSFELPFQKTLMALSAFWLTAILILALLKFPFWTIPILVMTALGIFYLFIRLLSSPHRESE